jgi:hypothetical protein
MAQVQPRRGGFRWVRSRYSTGASSPPTVPKVVASAYAARIGTGDVLSVQTDGTVYLCIGNEGTEGAPACVCDGAIQYLSADGVPRRGSYLPVTTYTGTYTVANPVASIVQVIPVTGQLFEAEMDTAVADWTAATALIGQAFDFQRDAEANTTTGQSLAYVVYATASTSAGQVILREVPVCGQDGTANDVTQAGWKGIFEFNPAEVDELL